MLKHYARKGLDQPLQSLPRKASPHGDSLAVSTFGLPMNPVPLTLALGPYDHTRDISNGSISIEGVTLRTLNLPIEEIFHRFTLHREWDISEMSMGMYSAMRAQGDTSVIALPIFISRAFRHSMFYVQDSSSIQTPADLAGKRIGVPEWAQTAGIYGRGYLSDYIGLQLSDNEWVQAGVNEPGRTDKVKLALPSNTRLTRIPDRSLDELLLHGEIDAVMSARPPASLGKGIARLLPNPEAQEEQYFHDTRIYPIMHVLVMKASLLQAHPWLPVNLYTAFEEAKRRSIERMSDITASYAPLPWLWSYASRMSSLFGEDFFPYGVGPDHGGMINRATLDAFLTFGFSQGICQRKLTIDELFPASTLSFFKV